MDMATLFGGGDMPIETLPGLREAAWDIINDECEQTFTIKQLKVKLPYGSKLRRAVCDLCNAGLIERIGYGVYKKPALH